MKTKILQFLSNLPAEIESSYELAMTTFVLEQSGIKNSLYEILLEYFGDTNTIDDQVAYNAFFSLNIIIRREKNYFELQALFDKYGKAFEYHVTFNHLKALFLIESDSLYDYGEILKLTYYDTKTFNNCAGFCNLFATVFAAIFEKGGIRDKKAFVAQWYGRALDAVNRAIELDHNYAKYYCTKARVLCTDMEFDEAIININKAIGLENSSRSDYVLRICDYQYYKIMIVTDRKLHDIANNILGKQGCGQLRPESYGISNLPGRELEKQSVVPPAAYTGEAPYVFASYSHLDADEVVSEIGLLQKHNYRIWFDEGLKPGGEYAEEIASRIENAAAFILFVSPNSINSEYVRKELGFALNSGHKPICIFIKDTTLSPGMKLQLDIYEHIFKYKLTDAELIQKLERVLGDKTRETA